MEVGYSRLIDDYRSRGLLHDMNGDGYSPQVVYVACVDGKHFWDMFGHTRKFVPMPHTLTEAGGALVLDPRFEYPDGLHERFGFGSATHLRQHMLGKIRHGMTHMQTTEVHLEGHIVCGVANALAWSPQQVMASLLRAAEYTRARVPGITKLCVRLHCAGGDNRRRTLLLHEPELLRELAELV